MALAKVLIKFMSSRPAGNVISGLALEPEILVPVGYGDFLTDVMRSRYNYFFYHRRIQTVLTDPVRLERYVEADIETRLTELLEKYSVSFPVIDISDADAEEALALGTVLCAHPAWKVSVLDYRVRDGLFIPLKNAEHLKRIPFPRLTSAEFRFLKSGTAFDALPEDAEDILYRRDLDRSVVRLIRNLSRVYYDRPAFWKDAAAKLRSTPVGLAPGRKEYLLDASKVPIRDEAFEELRERGILEQYVRQNGIINLVFPQPISSQLLVKIDRAPIMNVFLATALVREYGQAAAYHDLMLRDFKYVTGIRGCLPVILGSYNEQGGVEQICSFCSDAGKMFPDPSRKILVKESGLRVPEDEAEAAEVLGVEMIDLKELGAALEPR